MSRQWNRREMLQSISLGMIAGSELLNTSARAAVAPSLARCNVYNYRGEPLPVEQFARFHTCDLLLRPFTMQPQFEPGLAAFQPPDRPFRIALPMKVPGFGEVFVYADNRGRGYTPQSFSEKPLLLNYEFAADRLATVRTLWEECRRSGVTLSAAARERAEKAEALLKKAEGLAQDRAGLCGGAHVVVGRIALGGRDDRDRPGGARRSPATARGPASSSAATPSCVTAGESGKRTTERFEQVFNFATLPFYRGQTERELGRPNYSGAANILEWLAHTDIVPKGHPLIFLVPAATPDWLRNLSFEETKKLCLEHVRRSILQVPQPHPHLGRDQRGPRAAGRGAGQQRDEVVHQGGKRGADRGRAEGRPRGRPHLLPHRQFDGHLVRLLHGPPAAALAAERLRLPASG